MAIDPLLTTVDYTSRDYLSLRADLIGLIRERVPAWTASNQSDFGVALVEAMAYGIDGLHYFLDRVANESYLATAVQRDSLYSLAEMFGYRPIMPTAAVARLSFQNSTDKSMTLKIGTRFQASVIGDNGQTGIKFFELTEQVVVPAKTADGEPGMISGNAQEGRSYADEFLGISDGFARQKYLIGRRNVLPYATVVHIVTGEDKKDAGYSRLDWKEVEDITSDSVGPFDEVFQVIRQTDESLMVVFGDGVVGKIPPMHSRIYVSYRVGGGVAGNVPSGTIDTVVEPVIPGLSVTNQNTAYGGTDTESADSIRRNAARTFRSRDRAVTLADFIAVALSHEMVTKAKAITNNGSSVAMFMLDRGLPTPDNSQSIKPVPTDDTLKLVRDFIQERSMAGVTVSMFGPQWVDIYLRLDVIVAPTAKRSEVESEIRRQLGNRFSFRNAEFNSLITASDITTSLLGVIGMQGVTVTKISKDTPGSANEKTDALPVRLTAPSNAVAWVDAASTSKTVIVMSGGVED